MARTKTCEHCGVSFETTRPEARFCTRAHKNEAANLEASRGKLLYRYAMHWALGRRAVGTPEQKAQMKATGNTAFGDLTWLLDQFIAEDRAAGVSPPPYGTPDIPNITHRLLTRHEAPARNTTLREKALLEKVLGENTTEKAPEHATTD